MSLKEDIENRIFELTSRIPIFTKQFDECLKRLKKESIELTENELCRLQHQLKKYGRTITVILESKVERELK